MIVDPELVERYTREGWWGTRSLGEMVREHASARPGRPAYIEPDRTVSWSGYDAAGDVIAAALAGAGLCPGDRVALLLPDTLEFHAALIGTERAGVVAVGIGARAGDAEIAHLIARTGARGLITLAEHRGRDMTGLPAALAGHGVALELHLVLDRDAPPRAFEVSGGGRRELELPPAGAADLAGRAIGPNDLWLLNSTSGTTGLPKCVTQYQNRWLYFAKLAVESGGLGPDEVFFGAVPGPFGFGLWTAHVAPTLLGAPTVLLPRFTADELIELIDREKVTVLCAVSTQFRMMLKSPRLAGADLSSLRVMFTGGEAIPYATAADFEERTGAVVLNFFGSNESGAFSRTTKDDSREHRLGTGGRVIEEMDVRLYDEEGNDITATGGPGQPGGMGPLVCAGYYDDPRADEQLYAPDGHLLMGDLVTIDADGYLRVVGRKSDIIIRGGKNISAVEVESQVGTHPAVELVSVVPVPDEVYGERVCAVVSLLPGAALTLEELSEHLIGRGFSKELLPERLLVVDELPQASGGKIAKAAVRALAAERLAG